MKHIPALIGGLFSLFLGLSVKAQIIPVAIDSSSFTVDAIDEGGSDGQISGDLSNGFSPPGYFLVTQQYADDHPDQFDPTQTLPQDGKITSPANGAVFQLQPYDAADVAVVDGDATLTLSTPALYNDISLLVFNRSPFRTSPLSVTFNYLNTSVDASSTYNVPFFIDGNAPSDGEQAATYTALMFGDGSAVGGVVQFDQYDFPTDPSNGPLQSITVHNNANQLDVFAVSGSNDIMDVPEPSPWAAFLLGMVAFLGVTRQRQSRA